MTGSDHQSKQAEVRKEVFLPQTPAAAFELFVDHLGDWWPLATHSVGLAEAVGVSFGRGPGAKIVESLADGSHSIWGTVIAWDPPHLVSFTWHPGGDPLQATDVEVRFTSKSSELGGGTTVTLVHTGWERRSDAIDARNNYQHGWSNVLDCYTSMAARMTIIGQ